MIRSPRLLNVILWCLFLGCVAFIGCGGKSVESIVKKADELVADGKIEEAIVHYQKAIHKQPNEPVLYLNQAALLRKTKKYTNAIRDYEIVKNMNPESHWPYVGLGRVYRLQKQYENAKEILNEGLVKVPNHAAILFQLGRVSLDMKRGDEAISYFDQALTRNYRYMHKIYYYRGLTFETLLGEVQRAKLDYQSYLMMDHTEDKTEIQDRLKKLDGSNYQF